MKKTWEFIRKNSLTIMTMMISVLTLLIYTKQTSLLSKQTDALIEQNKATAWPHIYLGYARGTDFFAIEIGNLGNGPAIIENVVIRINGNEVENWEEVYSHFAIPDSIKKNYSTRIVNNIVYSPSVAKNIFETNDANFAQYMLDNYSNLEIEICYKSTFGDHWIARKKGLEITEYSGPFSECKLSASKYFKN